MINLNQIEQYYPENLRAYRKNILREYLQYKILEIIFNSKIAIKLSFLGGTALRIVYDASRFSEDLDFDNFGLTEDDFVFLSSDIKKRLGELGYQAEIKNVFKGAYRCYIKLPNILFDNQISVLKEEKIMIQIDTASHDFTYEPAKIILNKFDVFTQIFVTPLDILLAQKFYAALNRKRCKGRDFFDIIFLLQKTKPNYDYLKIKMGIKNSHQLKEAMEDLSGKINFNEVVKDVEPFLSNPSDSQKIKLFSQYLQQAKF